VTRIAGEEGLQVKRVRKVSAGHVGFLKISEQVSIHQSLRADPHIELERVGTEVKMEVKLPGRFWRAGKGTWKSECIRGLCLQGAQMHGAESARGKTTGVRAIVITSRNL